MIEIVTFNLTFDGILIHMYMTGGPFGWKTSLWSMILTLETQENPWRAGHSRPLGSTLEVLTQQETDSQVTCIYNEFLGESRCCSGESTSEPLVRCSPEQHRHNPLPVCVSPVS